MDTYSSFRDGADCGEFPFQTVKRWLFWARIFVKPIFRHFLEAARIDPTNGASSNDDDAAAAAATDLSSLVMNFTGSESEEISKSVMSSIEEISPMWKSSSLDSSLSREEREERTRQATGRAVFLQDLLVSALLSD